MAIEVDYDDLLARCAAIEKTCLAALSVTADAVPYFFHSQEGFPYFTNRIGPMTFGFDSEQYSSDVVQVLIRLVVAHIDEGYQGQPETKVYQYMPHVKAAFETDDGCNLISAAPYTSAPNYLSALNVTVDSARGLMIMDNSGLGLPRQVGTEFTLTVPMHSEIDRY